MAEKTSPPLVSVIIPTYNRAWALKTAIDSVFSQDYKNFELIVVDDGSTDQTEDLLAAYQGSITIIRQPRRGVSTARNRGISQATGGLIAFLDSDDYWYPKKLSAQVAFFEAHPDALICQCQEIWIRNGRRANPKKRHQKRCGMFFAPSLELCLISPSAVMVQKKLFDAVGRFDETLPACEDYDLWLRITSRYPVYLINDPLVVKRGGHNDQLSAKPGLDKYRIHAILKILNSGFLTDAQYKAAMCMLEKKCRIYADGCMKRGRKTVAMYYRHLAEHMEKKALTPSV